MTRGNNNDASYGAVVLPLKAFCWQGNEDQVELERSQCPSPSSSLDINTNPLIWEVADRLVLSLLMDSQRQDDDMEEDDDDDEDDEESEGDYLYRDCSDLPKPIPVHPANAKLLVSPAAAATTDNPTDKTSLPRSQSAMW